MPTHKLLPEEQGYGPIVRPGRNPLAISLLGVLLLSGVIGLFNPEKASPTLTRVLGEAVWVWHVGLIIGSAVTLLGIVVLRPLNDVLVERIGATWLASIFLAYGAVLAIVGGPTGATSAGISIGLGFAFAVRVWQITKDLARLRRILQAIPARESPTT